MAFAALTPAEALRQRWAAGRLAERRGDRAAAVAHFEAVQRLCSPERGAHAAAGAAADSAAGAQGADAAAETDAAAAPTPAAPPSAAGAAAAPDGDPDGDAGSGGAPAGSAGAGPGWEAEQAAGEVRVRGAGGGCESIISAAASAARLELLSLRGLLDGGRAALAAGPAAAAALAARLAPALLGGAALAAQLAGDRRALLQALALLQAREGRACQGLIRTHCMYLWAQGCSRASCAYSTRAPPAAAVCARPA